MTRSKHNDAGLGALLNQHTAPKRRWFYWRDLFMVIIAIGLLQTVSTNRDLVSQVGALKSQVDDLNITARTRTEQINTLTGQRAADMQARRRAEARADAAEAYNRQLVQQLLSNGIRPVAPASPQPSAQASPTPSTSASPAPSSAPTSIPSPTPSPTPSGRGCRFHIPFTDVCVL